MMTRILAALFAGDLLAMYQKYAETQGWRFEVMEASYNGVGGIKEVVAMVSGQSVYSKLKYESGAHRVQRVPVTESQGRVHTSTATVLVMPEVEEIAKKQAEESGGSFRRTNDMKDAFKDADIVYPKSWAPFGAMEKRTKLYGENGHEGIKALEKVLLEENGKHKDWACTEEMMSLTKDGKALYLHCLPADITGVSCEEGEVDATVFDRYRIPLYKEASYKPYVIAAMIFLSKFKNPVETLKELERKGTDRVQP